MAGADLRFTRRDFLSMPDDWRGELIEGELVMAPPPSGRHVGLVARLYERLLAHLAPDGSRRALVSPARVEIDRYTVLQPDLFVLREDHRLSPPTWRIPVPLWVAEILSPRTARYDRGPKIRAYARAGVEEAWLVDPRTESVEVRDLVAHTRRKFVRGEVAVSRAIPGFGVPVGDLFAL